MAGTLRWRSAQCRSPKTNRMTAYLWLCLSAAAAGIINAIAGGGTLLTFPALVAALPAAAAHELANATSTVALLPGSAASAWGYRKELAEARRWLGLLVPPSLAGGAVGALLVEEASFRILVPWLILTAAVLFLLQPAVARRVGRREPAGPPSARTVALLVVAQFLVAVYGGYFGAGIGIVMLSTLSFLGLGNIYRVNALKTVLALCINGSAALLFVARGLVVWQYALAMAAAAVLGGYVGARGTLALRPAVVRWVVIVIGFGLAAYYFYREGTAGETASSPAVRHQETRFPRTNTAATLPGKRTPSNGLQPQSVRRSSRRTVVGRSRSSTVREPTYPGSNRPYLSERKALTKAPGLAQQMAAIRSGLKPRSRSSQVTNGP